MPHIIFSNVKIETVTDFAIDYTSDLAALIGCPEDWILFYANESHIIVNKERSHKDCYVEVKWFDREEKIKTSVAQLITDFLESQGFTEIVVEFLVINNDNYYENMKKY